MATTSQRVRALPVGRLAVIVGARSGSVSCDGSWCRIAAAIGIDLAGLFGIFDVCESWYEPDTFVIEPRSGDAPPLWQGVRGVVDWDWVSDLQRALNERGAGLAVDVEYGPATRAAVAAVQEEYGLDAGDGWIGPQPAGASGLAAPDEARITQLAAGYPGS